MADLKAMLGALEVGGLRVRDATRSIRRRDLHIASQGALKDYAADKAREVLRLLPDGTYDFWDYLDDDVVSAVPIRMRLRATVDDGPGALRRDRDGPPGGGLLQHPRPPASSTTC